MYRPSGIPVASIASVISAIRFTPAAASATRTTCGSRCRPSLITSSSNRSSLIAAPTGPGSRWWNGRIPLNRCVATRRPGVGPGDHLLVRRVGVPERRDSAGVDHLADRLQPVLQLRRDRHHLDRVAQHLRHVVLQRRPQQRRLVRTASRLGQERAFQVDAGDHAVLDQLRETGRLRDQVVERRRDQAGERGRRTVLGVEGRDLARLLRIGGRVRRPAATVGVDVDEARHHRHVAEVLRPLAVGRHPVRRGGRTRGCPRRPPGSRRSPERRPA